MAKLATLDRTTPNGPVDQDPEVLTARRAVDIAVAGRDRAIGEARALRAILASPPSAGDGLAVLRARVGLPAAEVAEVEAALAFEEATAASARVETEARAVRLPAARARVATLVRQFYAMLDSEVMPIMLALREAIARENTALGRPMISPGELLWPELLGPSPRDSLLELRRELLRRSGWLARP